MTWTPIVGKGFTAEEFPNYLATVRMTSWRPRFITVHNTYMPTLAQWKDPKTAPLQRLKNLAKYYQGMGWHAGPAAFIADDKIWVFSGFEMPGVHSPSWNNTAWGIEIVADFATEPFADPQKSLVVSCLAALHKFGGLDPKTLMLHKEDPKTTHKGCPGKNLHKDELIRLIEEELVDDKDHDPYIDRELLSGAR